MKKLLKTLCAFALVIPIIFTSACKTKKNDEIPDPSDGTPPAEESTSTEESTLFDGTIYKIAEIDAEEIDLAVALLVSAFTELLEGTTIKIGNNGSFELSADIKSGISGMVQTVSGTCTDNNNILTIAEPKATSENFVLGQKVSSSEADAENFKKNITQDFDFKYAGNKNYIIATLNDKVPFVFVKDGYTTTQVETLGHASLLKESVHLSTNTYQDLLEYVSPYLVLVCNKSGTVTLECMDLDNCVAVTGIDSQSPSPNSFESTYLTEGNYENVQLHFDLNNDSQADTSFNIESVTIHPASSRLDFYR